MPSFKYVVSFILEITHSETAMGVSLVISISMLHLFS